MKTNTIIIVAIILWGLLGIDATAQIRRSTPHKTTVQKPKVTAANPWTVYEEVDDYTMKKSYRLNYTDEKNGLSAMFFPIQNHISIAKIYSPEVYMDEIIDAIVDNRCSIAPQQATVQYRLIKGKDTIERIEYVPIAFYGVADGQRIDRNGFYSFMSLNITADELKKYEYLTIKHYDKISKREVVRQIDLVGFYLAFLKLPEEYHGPVYKKQIEIDGHAKYQGLDINGTISSFEEQLKTIGFTHIRTDEKSFARYYSGLVDGEDVTLEVSVTKMTRTVDLVSEQYIFTNTTSAFSKYALLKDKLTKKYGNDFEKKENSHRINWVIPGGSISLDIDKDIVVSVSYSDDKNILKSISELREYIQKK